MYQKRHHHHHYCYIITLNQHIQNPIFSIIFTVSIPNSTINVYHIYHSKHTNITFKISLHKHYHISFPYQCSYYIINIIYCHILLNMTYSPKYLLFQKKSHL